MQKTEWINEIQKRTNFRKEDINEIINVIIDIFHDIIKQRVEFDVRGFGQIRYTTREAHEGSKPTPGVKGKSEKIWIPEKESVRFHLSKDLRDHMKEDVEDEESS